MLLFRYRLLSYIFRTNELLWQHGLYRFTFSQMWRSWIRKWVLHRRYLMIHCTVSNEFGGNVLKNIYNIYVYTLWQQPHIDCYICNRCDCLVHTPHGAYHAIMFWIPTSMHVSPNASISEHILKTIFSENVHI